MLILSHRGFHERAPENTLAAFDAAAALGVDGIETDIRLSADAQLVLFHDRLAPDGRPVASLARDELSRLVGYEVPTLESALARLPDMLWNLEIKTPAALEPLIAVLRGPLAPWVACPRLRGHGFTPEDRSDMSTASVGMAPTRRLLVTSFIHPLVDDICLRLRVDGGLLVAHRPAEETKPGDWISGHTRVGSIVWDYNSCDEQLLRQSAAQGALNFVYGAETKAELAELARWDVAGVITDRPDHLLS